MENEISTDVQVTPEVTPGSKTTANHSCAPWILLGCAVLLYFCANLQKVVVPGATFDELQKLLHLNATEVTRLSATFFYTYAILQLVAGPLADRFSGAWVISIAGSCLVLGSLGSALTFSMPFLLFCRVLTAIGAAMVYLSLVQIASRLFGEKLPLVLGAFFIIGYAGSVVGTAPFSAGVRAVGYSQMMLAAGLLALVIYFIYLAVIIGSRPHYEKPQVQFSGSELLRAFSFSNILTFLLSGIPFAISYVLLATIGKKFLQDYTQMSPASASQVMLVMAILCAVNGFIAAWLSLLMNHRKLPILWYSAAGTLIVQFLFVFFMLVQCHAAWLFALLIWISATTGNIAPIYVVYLREHNDARKLATVVGVSNAIAYLLVAVLANTCGKLLDVYPAISRGDGIQIYSWKSYLLVFAVFTAISAISAISVCILTVKDHKKIQTDKVR